MVDPSGECMTLRSCITNKNFSISMDEIKSLGKLAIRSSFKIASAPSLQPPLQRTPAPSYLKRITDREFPKTHEFIPNNIKEV